MTHMHTLETQPDDYRAHLKDEHGIVTNDSPIEGKVPWSAKALVAKHAEHHPDHEVLLPSLHLVKT
jgi:hypothetical protein